MSYITREERESNSAGGGGGRAGVGGGRAGGSTLFAIGSSSRGGAISDEGRPQRQCIELRRLR